MEKDRDGCPKIINLGSSRTDLFYQVGLQCPISYSSANSCIEKEFSESLEVAKWSFCLLHGMEFGKDYGIGWTGHIEIIRKWTNIY